MDFAAGTWDLTGSENFDEYMKVVGKNIYVIPNNHNQTVCHSTDNKGAPVP